jgi:alkanesulfonate monooxygenase SsuD/methylene tetrahydromethanopterin reductase-like flavin-dependent oxidoreductase (luciferase family)
LTFGLILMFDASNGEDTKTVYRQTLESAHLAKESGFSSLWLTEHHGKQNRLCPSIPLMMSYLAQHTDMDLGAATILLSHYPARHIAEEMGMLSNMYPNRFSFGFAKGGNGEVELHDNGDDDAARRTMVRHLDELQNFLADTTKEGSYPKPSAKLPLFVASKDDETVRYAAKHDIGIMAGQKWTLGEVQDVMHKYSSYHPNAKTPEVLLSRYFLICDDDAKAVDKVMDDTAKRKAKNNKANEISKNPLKKEVLEDESPVGSLPKAKALFERYRNMGISHLALRQATFDVDETMSSIKQIASLIKS